MEDGNHLESLHHPSPSKLLLDSLVLIVVLLIFILPLVTLHQLKVMLKAPGKDLRPTRLTRFQILQIIQSKVQKMYRRLQNKKNCENLICGVLDNE